MKASSETIVCRWSLNGDLQKQVYLGTVVSDYCGKISVEKTGGGTVITCLIGKRTLFFTRVKSNEIWKQRVQLCDSNSAYVSVWIQLHTRIRIFLLPFKPYCFDISIIFFCLRQVKYLWSHHARLYFILYVSFSFLIPVSFRDIINICRPSFSALPYFSSKLQVLTACYGIHLFIGLPKLNFPCGLFIFSCLIWIYLTDCICADLILRLRSLWDCICVYFHPLRNLTSLPYSIAQQL